MQRSIQVKKRDPVLGGRIEMFVEGPAGGRFKDRQRFLLLYLEMNRLIKSKL